MAIDPRAVSGFGPGAQAYERVRPTYPPAAVAEVVRELGLDQASTVLDLAAGTGKLTRALLPLVGHVIAVDQSAAMLAQLREQVPDAVALVGTAEQIPLGDGAVDAVFVGQAFHWFATARACGEIARVLVRGGGLALLWNEARWKRSGLPWLADFLALTEPFREQGGQFVAPEEWQATVAATGLFAPIATDTMSWTYEIGADDFAAMVGTWSWIANLPDARRRAVLEAVRDLVAGGDRPLRLHYCTEVYWTRALEQRAPGRASAPR